MKRKTIPALAVVATLAGCVAPMTDSEQTIGEVGQALLPPTPAPVGHWRFNVEGQDVVILNEEPLSLPAALSNGASCKHCPKGNPIIGQFDGDDDIAEIEYNSALDFTSAMTVSAWVRPHGTSAPQTLVSKWDAPNSYRLWLSDGSYRFSVALAGGGEIFSVAAPATPDVFSHVTGVFNGTSLKIYVDGALKASMSAVGTLQASARPVTIGNHPIGDPFGGAIVEVQVYNVALTEEQVYSGALSGTEYVPCTDPNQCCPI